MFTGKQGVFYVFSSLPQYSKCQLYSVDGVNPKFVILRDKNPNNSIVMSSGIPIDSLSWGQNNSSISSMKPGRKSI